MLGTCKLNNKSMRAVRREATYQCLVIDLAMLNVITKSQAEMLIGGGIPAGLYLPNGESALNQGTSGSGSGSEPSGSGSGSSTPAEPTDPVDPETTADPETPGN